MSDHITYKSGIGQVTESVFIGGASAIEAVEDLRAEGVTHVLALYEEGPTWPTGFLVCEIPIEDGVLLEGETLDRGVSFMREATEAGHKVLVVCGLGISRSATFVLAYLVEQGYDLKEAYQLLRYARPQVWPMRALWVSLTTHYGIHYSLAEIEGWRKELSDSAAR